MGFRLLGNFKDLSSKILEGYVRVFWRCSGFRAYEKPATPCRGDSTLDTSVCKYRGMELYAGFGIYGLQFWVSGLLSWLPISDYWGLFPLHEETSVEKGKVNPTKGCATRSAALDTFPLKKQHALPLLPLLLKP